MTVVSLFFNVQRSAFHQFLILVPKKWNGVCYFPIQKRYFEELMKGRLIFFPQWFFRQIQCYRSPTTFASFSKYMRAWEDWRRIIRLSNSEILKMKDSWMWDWSLESLIYIIFWKYVKIFCEISCYSFFRFFKWFWNRNLDSFRTICTYPPLGFNDLLKLLLYDLEWISFWLFLVNPYDSLIIIENLNSLFRRGINQMVGSTFFSLQVKDRRRFLFCRNMYPMVNYLVFRPLLM